MSNLSELQAIQAKIMEKHSLPKGMANIHIAGLCECKVNTVERWLSESQDHPIPKPQLRLLKLLI